MWLEVKVRSVLPTALTVAVFKGTSSNLIFFLISDVCRYAIMALLSS